MQRNPRHGTRDMCSVYISLMAVDSSVFSQLKTTEVQRYTLWSVINRVRVCFLFLHEMERERGREGILCLHLKRRRWTESLKSPFHIEFQFQFKFKFKFNATLTHCFNAPVDDWMDSFYLLVVQTDSK